MRPCPRLWLRSAVCCRCRRACDVVLLLACCCLLAPSHALPAPAPAPQAPRQLVVLGIINEHVKFEVRILNELGLGKQSMQERRPGPLRQGCAPDPFATRWSRAVAQVFDGPPATVAELAAVEEDLSAGAMQVRVERLQGAGSRQLGAACMPCWPYAVPPGQPFPSLSSRPQPRTLPRAPHPLPPGRRGGHQPAAAGPAAAAGGLRQACPALQLRGGAGDGCM